MNPRKMPTVALGEPSGDLLLQVQAETEQGAAAANSTPPPAEPNPEKLKVREGADPSES